MPITTPQGFDAQMQEPLEIKKVQSDIAARDAITISTRYQGLEVYVVDEQKSYRLQGGTANGNWVEQINDLSPFINTSTGAADAGKPIVLDAAGKIDSTMLTASDLSLYYLLDGTRPLTGNMNAGGFKLANLAAATIAGDAVEYNQLINGWVAIGATATNSTNLNGQASSYYLDYTNFTGTIDSGDLPVTIASNTTGNAATATTAGQWTTQRLLSLTGDVTGSVWVQGGSNMSLAVIVTDNSHNHTVSNITGTSDVFNRAWAGTGGDFGTAVTVARGDHTHASTPIAWTTLTLLNGWIGSAKFRVVGDYLEVWYNIESNSATSTTFAVIPSGSRADYTFNPAIGPSNEYFSFGLSGNIQLVNYSGIFAAYYTGYHRIIRLAP